MSNAIKFSNKGGSIEVKVNTLPDDKIEVVIADHGIGMPEEIKKNIFRSDKQTSRKGTSGEESTGFGMPLVKTYMDHYNGSISVESYEQSLNPEKHGTTYRLIFQSGAASKAA